VLAARKKKRRINILHLIFLLLCLLGLTAIITFFTFFVSIVKDMPVLSPATLEANTTNVIFDKDQKLIARIGARNSEPVKIKDIPEHVRNAFLAIEDNRFYQHRGIDPRAIIRAAWSDFTVGEVIEGGSTITQQLIKNSILSPERTLKRKIQEAVLAIMVERIYTKNEILEMYLNKVYLGEGSYGIKVAARTYFGKEVKNLSLNEAATLAGLLQAPSRYSPYQDPSSALARRNIVMDKMLKYNLINSSQYKKAKSEKLTVLAKKPSTQQPYPYPFFLDFVMEQLVKEYGEDKVNRGGFKIYTTLDPNIQKIVEAAINNKANFPPSRQDARGIIQPQCAVVIVDPHTGQIKAMAGGRDNTKKQQFNRASQSFRQPGSAFKPIAVYGPAVEYKGAGPTSVVDDSPVKYGSYEPHNYDGRYRGLITYRSALAHSVNVAAVKILMNTVTIPIAIKFAANLGIVLDPKMHGASMALGGLHTGVSPLQMAGAYGAFANLGIYIEPTAIVKIERPDGAIIDKVPEQHQAMKPASAYLITDMLKSVVQNGTGTRAKLNRPAAGKTGTTDDGKDIWFAGYTPELVGVIWIGYDTPKAMPLAFGGTYPAQIWKEIMSKSLRYEPVKDFPKPKGMVNVPSDEEPGLFDRFRTPKRNPVAVPSTDHNDSRETGKNVYDEPKPAPARLEL